MSASQEAATATADSGWRRELPDEKATQALAARFAAVVRPPLAIYLRGDLGAGKTAFARAYIQALGFEGYVKSPSYGLLETYRVRGQAVLHLDLYRIEDPGELEYLALRDLYDASSVLLVEWPDRGGSELPPADLVLDFGESGGLRHLDCSARTARGRSVAEALA